MNLDALHKQIENMGHLDKTHKVEKHLNVMFAEMGLENYIFAMLVPTSMTEPKSYVLSNYPLSWLIEYRFRRFNLVDPVLQHGYTKTSAMIWKAEDKWEEHSPKTQDFVAAVIKRGWKCGILFPVHTADNNRGLLHFSFKKPYPEVKDKIDNLSFIGPFLGLKIQQKVFELVVEKELNPAGVVFSQRETECLRWAADGKTAWEIGKILGIAETTVRSHLDSTVTKLKVNNRQQAIAKALAMGLVTPQLIDVGKSLLNWETAQRKPAEVTEHVFKSLDEIEQFVNKDQRLYFACEDSAAFPQTWLAADSYKDLIMFFFDAESLSLDYRSGHWNFEHIGENCATSLAWDLDEYGKPLPADTPVDRVLLAFWETCRLTNVGAGLGFFFIDRNPDHARVGDDKTELSCFGAGEMSLEDQLAELRKAGEKVVQNNVIEFSERVLSKKVSRL